MKGLYTWNNLISMIVKHFRDITNIRCIGVISGYLHFLGPISVDISADFENGKMSLISELVITDKSDMIKRTKEARE